MRSSDDVLTVVRRAVVPLVAAGALALGLSAEHHGGAWPPSRDWVPDLLVGWTLVVCGLLVAARRPRTWTGPLLAAAGLAWFVPNFGLAGTVFLHRGPLLHAAVGAPDGRPRSPVTRGVIAMGYVAAVVPALWRNDGVTLVVAAFVVVGAGRSYLTSVGPHRRARRPAVAASVVLALLLTAEVLTRRSAGAGADNALLTTYQIGVVLVALVVTVGLLSRAVPRAEVTDLVVELGSGGSATLRARLAAALGDPALDVGFWSADTGHYLDPTGRIVPVADMPGRAVTAVERDGQPFAVILHDPTVLDDPELVQAVSAATRLAATNAQLQAEVHARLTDAAASRRRILAAADDSRHRLERRLSGGVQQRLGRLSGELDDVRPLASDEETAELLGRAADQLARSRDDLSRLARGLHPTDLDELGLAGAIESLARAAPLPVDLDVADIDSEPSIHACAYFVCSEALANIAKYAAASRAVIRVTRTDRTVVVRVEDDGVGGADPARGSGLRGLDDRLAALGGRLEVDSPDGGGTTITATIPT